MIIKCKYPRLTITGLLFCLGAFCSNGYSNTLTDTLPGKKYTHFRPFPIAAYLPETKFAGGALGVLLFKAGNDSNTRTSNVDFAIVYTQRGQLVIDPMCNIFTKKEKYVIKSAVLYTKNSEYFYGVGNGTIKESRENITFNSVKINLRVLKKVKANFFVGFQYQYFNTYNINYPPHSSLKYQHIEGGSGSITSGLGPSLVFDSRNSILTPTRGHYFEISNFIFNRKLGSRFNFTNFIIDFRKYIKVNKRGIIAFQSFLNMNFGHVPFKQLAMIGGSNLMRGYYLGRFRDKKLIVLQAELRQHLFWKIGYTVFADIGNVTPNFELSELSDIVYTAGGGLRYKLLKSENINIRLDFGFGKNTSGLYMTLSEAF